MRNSKAFTLIEIISVVAIIGIMVAATTRVLTRPKDKWPRILNGLNNLISLARQEAITQRKVHRLVFTSREGLSDQIVLFREEDDPERVGSKVYKEVRAQFLDSLYAFPTTIRLHTIFINGEEPEDELSKGVSSYINIDGMMQDTTIFLIRTRDVGEDRVTLILKPFAGEFILEDGFVRPERRRFVREENVEQ